MSTEPKVALVTGAGSGIGRATADAFHHAGYAVMALDRHLASVEAWAAAHGASRARAVHADVTDAAEVVAAVEATVRAFGGLDVLVNNAGIQIDAPIEELAEEIWRRVIDTNLTGTFLCARAAIPHLRARRGVIVNTGSPIARLHKRGVGCYAAAKAGVEALTRVLALELAADGVRVNCILPGSTDTPLVWAKVPEAERPARKLLAAEEQPVGRIAQPSEIAAVTLFLASDAAGFMTGSSVVVDGGIMSKIATRY